MGVEEERIVYNQIEDILNKINAGDMISEITKDGSGQDFY